MMDLTLRSLVAPISDQEFRQLLAERRFAHFPTDDATRFDSLLTSTTLLELLAKAPQSPEGIQVTGNRKTVPPMLFTTNTGTLDSGRLLKLLESNHSLLIRRLENRSDSIARLTRSIRNELQERVSVVAILTNGPGGAFNVHFDPYDLIVLQIEGAKVWRVHAEAFIDPVKDLTIPEPPSREAPKIFERSLRKGEALFLPAGSWHECENDSERSLHIAFLLEPPCGYSVLKTLTKNLLNNPTFRKPVGRGDPLLRVQAHEALKATLLEHLSETSAEALFDAYLDDLN
jgi:ribosomal protein L16 Arg81 hydroxylase